MAVADIEDQDEREDLYSHIKEIELSRQDAIEEADRVLAEIVRAGRRATSGELAYFQAELRWDERQVRQEIRRMMNVIRDRAIAGSANDRAAAQAEAETAAGILQREGVKVDAKIAELQAKKSAMERDAKLSSQRVVDQAEAIGRLRQNAPMHIREAVRHRESELAHGIGRKLSDCEIRFNELDCNLTPSRYPNEPAYLDSLRTSCREAVESFTTGGYIKYKLAANWPVIRQQLEAERERLAGEIATLKKEIESEQAEIRKSLNFYTRGEN